MQGTYYETDRVFLVLLFALVYCVIYILVLRAELNDKRSQKVRAIKQLKRHARKVRKYNAKYRI